HGLARRKAVPARFYFSSTNGGRTFLCRLNATVSCPRIYESSVGARQLVRQDGGRAANFRARNRCNLPRRAHQLASAYGNPVSGRKSGVSASFLPEKMN